ncbi:MAG: DinB family protein [Saprospiraceae bacterium]
MNYTEYNSWANNTIAGFLKSEMKQEDFTKPMGNSFSSIADTILHIWGAQEIWQKRLEGLENPPFPTMEEKNKITVLEVFEKSSQNFESFVRKGGEEMLSKEFEYKNMAGHVFFNKGWEMVHHCMNHSTFHRGQIITMSRQLGYDNLPGTDQIKFFRI